MEVNMNTIKCPHCGREHSILRKNGELREKIYCRCKVNGSHTLIRWIAGIGYCCLDNDLTPIFVE